MNCILQLAFTILLLNLNSVNLTKMSCQIASSVTECLNKTFSIGDKINDGPIATSVLKFKDCSVKTIYLGLFESTKSLNMLSMEENQVESIEPGALNNLSELTRLDLDRNKLKTITRGVFNALLNLRTLYVVQNKITSIENGSFVGLTKLNKLFLYGNRISSLNRETFRSLSSLTVLEIYNNNIKTIGPNTFAELRQLQRLQLDKNELEISEPIEIDSKIFSGLINLSTLSLKSNKLKTLPPGLFMELNQLQLLDVSSNNLYKLSFGTFTGLNQLTTLNIGFNKLDYLFEESFSPLVNVQNLQIDNNFITTINAVDLLQNLPKLRTLKLNGNRFESCKELYTTFRLFKERNVSITSDENFYVSNVQGIRCTDVADKPINSQKSFESFLMDLNKTFTEEVKLILHNFTQINGQRIDFERALKNHINNSDNNQEKLLKEISTNIIRGQHVDDDLKNSLKFFLSNATNFNFGSLSEQLTVSNQEQTKFLKDMHERYVANLTNFIYNVTASFWAHSSNGTCENKNEVPSNFFNVIVSTENILILVAMMLVIIILLIVIILLRLCFVTRYRNSVKPNETAMQYL